MHVCVCIYASMYIIYVHTCIHVQVCLYVQVNLFAIDKKSLKIVHIGDRKLIEFGDVFQKGYRVPRMKVTHG